MRKTIERLYDFPKVKGLSFDGPKSVSMTQQQFKDDCDVNNIIARYNHTGSWSSDGSLPTRQPQFGEYVNVDFQSLQNTIATANNDFSLLPSHIRRQFGDNVNNLLDFLANPENQDEAVKLGLLPHQHEELLTDIIPKVDLETVLSENAELPQQT